MCLLAPQRCALDIQVFRVGGSIGTERWLDVLIHGVTEVRDLERTQDELVSTGSQELRTPLASLVRFTELLLEQAPTNSNQRQHLQTMAQDGQRLTDLINDFLEPQYLEAGRRTIISTRLDLNALLTDGLGVALVGCHSSGCAQRSLHLAESLGRRYCCARMLAHLLSNARAGTPQPEGTSASRLVMPGAMWRSPSRTSDWGSHRTCCHACSTSSTGPIAQIYGRHRDLGSAWPSAFTWYVGWADESGRNLTGSGWAAASYSPSSPQPHAHKDSLAGAHA